MSTNYSQEGDIVELTFSTLGPTAGDPIVKCAAKTTGGLVGFALNGTASTAGETIRVATKGVFSYAGVVTVATTVGSYLYVAVPATATSTSTAEIATAVISTDNAGLLFGRTLTAISAVTAAQTIDIMIEQPRHI
jgi:predicted RecA/RadA family phage recombinase